MSETIDVTRREDLATTSPERAPSAPDSSLLHPAERPIDLWPEGVLAALAGITLVVIGFRHRLYLQRKAQEVQRMVDEFQREGGVEEIKQVARQAAELLKG